jgi:hypothetical protein
MVLIGASELVYIRLVSLKKPFFSYYALVSARFSERVDKPVVALHHVMSWGLGWLGRGFFEPRLRYLFL